MLVEEPGKTRDRAAVVSGSMAGVFQEGFGVPHVGSVGGVGREHGLVLAGGSALQGKLEGDILSSPVQPLLLEGEQGHLIAGVYRLNPSMQGWRPDRGTECSSIMLDRDA